MIVFETRGYNCQSWSKFYGRDHPFSGKIDIPWKQKLGDTCSQIHNSTCSKFPESTETASILTKPVNF